MTVEGLPDAPPTGTLIRFEWRDDSGEVHKQTVIWPNVPRKGEFVHVDGHYRAVVEVAWSAQGDAIVSL